VTVAALATETVPRSLARVSDISALLTVARFGLDPLGEMMRLRARHGRLAEISFQSGKKTRRYLLASGARYNKRVLSDVETFQSIGVMLNGPQGSAQRRIANGLLGPAGPQQAHYRRILLPPLRRTAVDQLTGKIATIVTREIDGWPLDAPSDLFALCKSLVTRAALEALFPRDEAGCSEEMLAAAKLIDEHIELEASPLVRGMPRDWPGLPYARVLRHAEKVEAGLLAWARKEADAGRADNLMCVLAGTPDESGADAGEKAILNQLPTLFGAAYETTQTALAWALFLLAQHPAAHAALLEELQALPDDSPERLLECKWPDAVVRESMRLLPSVPTQTRRVTRDADLVDCDVEAGSYVVLSAFLTNREPDVYGQPDRFMPERWSRIDPGQFEYLAFSAGPRTCIGSSFAANFLRIAVGRIVRRYRVQIGAGARIDHKVRITLKPGRGGLPVTLTAQDGRFQASAISGSIRKIVRFDT